MFNIKRIIRGYVYPAKRLFTADDGRNTFLKKFGDSVSPWIRFCVERMLACGTTEKETILSRFVEQFNGRLPLLAAGKITSSQAAQRSLETGLLLVALGRTIVMNPNWMELVQGGHEDKVKNKLILFQRSDELAIPEKLWHVIQKTPGWFPT